MDENNSFSMHEYRGCFGCKFASPTFSYREGKMVVDCMKIAKKIIEVDDNCDVFEPCKIWNEKGESCVVY